MTLPESIEIIPPSDTVQAHLTVPGSKSITNRALILAALGDGETTLEGALWSEDTEVMVECLREIGFMVELEVDAQEPCNRRITVYGRGGTVPPGGTREQPLELFVGNAGTAARFLTAFLCLGRGVYRLHGVPRMHERPQAALFTALRQLNYTIESPNDKLPALILGGGPRPGHCAVSIAQSSQFASALLLAGNQGGWSVSVTDENSEESSYVAMTSKLIQAFPRHGGAYGIEPDASGGSYFVAAGALLRMAGENREQSGPGCAVPLVNRVTVNHWPSSGWQIDQHFPEVLSRLLAVRPASAEPLQVSRRADLGDSIMTAIVMSPFAPQPTRFTDLGRLRLQECERVAALRTELGKCGAKVLEHGDTLEIFPSHLQGATIETYGDHRMAMCFAILGLKIPGIILKNPSCVKKTFPNFFQKLAAPAPAGLGVLICEPGTGRLLGTSELFAE